MNTFTTTCPLTGTQKNYEVIADGFCVNSFKNGAGKTSVTLFRTLASTVDKVATFVAERHGNDLAEIKDDLKFNGVKEDISNELNQYLVSKLS